MAILFSALSIALVALLGAQSVSAQGTVSTKTLNRYPRHASGTCWIALTLTLARSPMSIALLVSIGYAVDKLICTNPLL